MAAFASSALIVLGLVHYLCCLVANYAHIKDGIKLRDYEEAIKEELELRCEMAAANRKRADLWISSSFKKNNDIFYFNFFFNYL